MPSYTTSDIRNVLIAGHGGSGKSTLVDAMLFASNTVNRKASVADRNDRAEGRCAIQR
jgi:elongation factor G